VTTTELSAEIRDRGWDPVVLTELTVASLLAELAVPR
jgi:hypothetical protein